MKLLKLRFFYFACLLITMTAWAQEGTVTGVISDENGMPVPGASILVKGTSTSASSDIDGKFTITAGPASTLVFSYVGYANQEVAVGNKTVLNISLAQGAKNLDEVVVVGYGTQKKSVVTGAISSVKARDLESVPVNTVGQSLQGRVSGVTVFANSGQPGSGATIRVRGVSSFSGANDPLFVVDGVQSDNINNINQSDIESMEVLKDAASAAIYGTRAANGVILITTKKGKSGKLTVNYNGYAGSSAPARKIDLLNATQYATLRNEQYANSFSTGSFQLPFPNAAALGAGTNWQDQIFNNSAQRSNHELSVSGGTDKSNFFMSVGLLDQDGIVTTDISKYSRKSLRVNSEHKINNWLKIGEQAFFTHEKSTGIGNTNDEHGGPLASAINLDPTTPVIVTDPSTQPNAGIYTGNAVRDANGNFYGISNDVQQEITNPLAYTQTRLGNYDWADNIQATLYVEVTPFSGLKFRSQATGKQANYGSESFTPRAYLNANNNTTVNNLSRSSNRNFRWNVENTISYTKDIAGHSFTALLGQAAYVDDIGQGESVRYNNQPVNNYQDASFGWSTIAADISASAYKNVANTLSSLFARATYDYKERYLFTGIIRRDGSSKFGANHKYGTFPSFSLGWNVAKENFWKENNVVNQLKIRGGYGVTGNDGPAGNKFRYASLIGGGYNYTIGNSGNVTVGNTQQYPANPDIRWEETSMTNIGLDVTLINDLTISAEWYNKETTGGLQPVIIPSYIGAAGTPFGNVTSMKNTGFEIEAAYRKSLGDLNVTVSGNFTTLKNTITGVGADRLYNDGPRLQSSTYALTRSAVGTSYNSFYGFVTDGIFQNQAEIDASPVPSDSTVPTQPGDFKFKDLDGDGKITEKDRTYLGKPLPDFTYGITLAFEYKGFDLKLFGQGVGGNQIYQGLRRLDIPNANWQTNALNRWVGEGTSNTYPRLSTTDPNGNFSKPSNFQLQDGDYFRMKIIQLGYSLPSDILTKVGISKIRIYATAENVFTFTKYTGFDPEIGGDVSGIDRGYYPQARSFMLGCNIQL